MSGAADRASAAMRDMAVAPQPSWRDTIEPAAAAAPPPEPTGRVWSPMQEAIFTAVREPGGHLVVEALAGTGKSTTIEEAVFRTPKASEVLVCAFNKSIADAMRERLPDDIEVRTLHSLGARVVRQAMGNRPLEPRYVDDLAAEIFGRSRETREARTGCCHLVALAKGTLLNFWDDEEAAIEALDEMADCYGIDCPRRQGRHAWLRAALTLLQRCSIATEGPINYDDQIWLPAIHDLPVPQYDYVFVDETQDLNAAQLWLCRSAAADRGRIVAIGDRRQAIYGFRGADSQAIPRMVRELQARVLPLSVTYRCPLAVVREANAIVPELQAAPKAAAGIVREALEEELCDKAVAGDFVLSRTNAPLIALCWRWLAAGRKARMQGRDIGAGLISWARQLSEAAPRTDRAAELLRRARSWATKEIERLEAAERPCDALLDRLECLEALSEGTDSVADVIDKAEQMFADDGKPAILCSSTHRAKGLEADRVWLLRDTYRPEEGGEEANLLYVAITRAKQELIYVHKKERETP